MIDINGVLAREFKPVRFVIVTFNSQWPHTTALSDNIIPSKGALKLKKAIDVIEYKLAILVANAYLRVVNLCVRGADTGF